MTSGSKLHFGFNIDELAKHQVHMAMEATWYAVTVSVMQSEPAVN